MRMRTIKPGFFTNEALACLDPLARLLFAGLWCHCDRAGRCEDRPRRIKVEVLPFDDCDADGLLQQLHDAGLIVRYERDGVRMIEVPKFAVHQRPHKNEQGSTLPGQVVDGPRRVHGRAKAVPTTDLGNPIQGTGDREQEAGVQGTGSKPLPRAGADGPEDQPESEPAPEPDQSPDSDPPPPVETVPVAEVIPPAKHPDADRLLAAFKRWLPGICATRKAPIRTKAMVAAADRLCRDRGGEDVALLLMFYATAGQPGGYQPGATFDWREHITSLVYVERQWPKLDGERRRQGGPTAPRPAPNGHAQPILAPGVRPGHRGIST